jgi:hypothetical protein
VKTRTQSPRQLLPTIQQQEKCVKPPLLLLFSETHAGGWPVYRAPPYGGGAAGNDGVPRSEFTADTNGAAVDRKGLPPAAP